MPFRSVLLPLIALAVACFGATEPLPSDTGVVVQVSLWPIVPVEIEGQPSRTRPAAGARVAALDEDGRAAAAITRDDGSARMLLAPGRYTIVVEDCPGAMSLPKESAEIDVTAGSFVTARLTCDTGIR